MELKPCFSSDGFEDTAGVFKMDAGLFSCVQQGVQNSSSAIGGGEQLSSSFLLEKYPFTFKKVDGVLDGIAAENISDHRFGTGVVIPFGHLMVGHVASASAGHQDFGADLLRAIE